MRKIVLVIFLLSFMAGLWSCRRTPASAPAEASLQPADSLTSDTLPADPPEPPELLQLEASLSLDRAFDDFMFAFVRSPRLQRERVVYPLPFSSPDSTRSGSLRFLDCNGEFGFLRGDYYTQLFGNASQIEETKVSEENAVSVERISLLEGQIRSFLFERRHGKWMLVGLREQEIAQSDYADFLAFYAQFSSDSIFQRRHLAPRLRFSMLDPEDEGNYVEGTITAQQWFSFCPEVPGGIISNIRYGQTYSPRHMVLQKCGSANGLQEIFTFQRRAQRWLLISYEN